MPRFALIIPAYNEAEALAKILPKLQQAVDPKVFAIVVGANHCSDATAKVATDLGVLVGETQQGGYGYGCQVAIDLARKKHPEIEAYIFFAADGANSPEDIARLVEIYESGVPFVLGQRTRRKANGSVMTFPHIFANRILGAWCGLLTGRFYCDLGPMRLISRSLFDAMSLREWTYGWTIEPQILAARMGIATREIDVAEFPRIAGEQKVSHVSWRKTLQVGGHILAAGWRARFRTISPCPTPIPRPSLPQDSLV